MSTAVGHPPADPREAEALIKEARRRQRRRYLGTGAAILAAAAASWSALVAGGGHSRHGGTAQPRPVTAASPPAVPRGRALPGQAGGGLLMWPQGGGGPGPSYVEDLGTGQVTLSERPDISAGDYQPLVIATGGYLVYVGNGVTAIRTDLRGRPRVLGPTPFFAPAVKPGYVWLEYTGGVRLVPVRGGPAGPLIALPHGTRLIAGMDTALLLDSRRGRPELWAPGSSPQILPQAAHSDTYQDIVDVTPRLVAYGSRCRDAVARPRDGVASSFQECRVLRVFDAVTHRLRTVASPPGTAGWVPGGIFMDRAVSPGGAWVAVGAAAPRARAARERIFVVRLNGRPGPPVTAVPGSSAPVRSRLAWSAHGSWLLYQGPGSRLWGFRVTTGSVRPSRVPCCQYTVMVGLPAVGSRR